MPNPIEMGFDAAVEFPPHGLRARRANDQIDRTNPAYQGDVWDYISAAQNAIARPPEAYPLFRGVMTGWDNTPRLQNNGQIFVNAHPENYRRWLAGMVDETRERLPPDRQFVFINAWNEWAEGCHLEPDLKWGHQYLEATKAALDAAAAGAAPSRDGTPTEPKRHSRAKLAYWRARAFLAEQRDLFDNITGRRG